MTEVLENSALTDGDASGARGRLDSDPPSRRARLAGEVVHEDIPRHCDRG